MIGAARTVQRNFHIVKCVVLLQAADPEQPLRWYSQYFKKNHTNNSFMKKTSLTLLLLCTAFISSFGFVTAPFTEGNALKAAAVMVPVGKNGQTISLEQVANMSVKAYAAVVGRRLNMVERLNFKLAQRKLKQDINADGTIKTDAVKKYYAPDDHSQGFHLGGLLLGLFLSVIGVGIAFLIGGEARRNRVYWALAGASAGLLFLTIAFLGAA